MLSKNNLMYAKRCCNENISLIENYEKAVNDSKKYDCHHRLEIQEDGTLISRQKLIEMNLYYDRPASELIFLTHSDHARLHGKNRPKEVLESISKANKGKHLSEETKRKLSEANKGKLRSEETKRMISENHKSNKNGMYGKDSWNKNKRNVYSKETLMKFSQSKIGEKNPYFGTHYYNNGEIELRAKKCPEGFVKGRLKNSLINLKQHNKNGVCENANNSNIG